MAEDTSNESSLRPAAAVSWNVHKSGSLYEWRTQRGLGVKPTQ